MALPGIAAALARIGALYAEWRGAEFILDRVKGDSDEHIDGLTTVRSDMPGTAIQWIEYNPVSARLAVRFKNRPRSPAYIYSKVPRLVWLGWLQAGSKGGYYHARVKQHTDFIR